MLAEVEVCSELATGSDEGAAGVGSAGVGAEGVAGGTAALGTTVPAGAGVPSGGDQAP